MQAKYDSPWYRDAPPDPRGQFLGKPSWLQNPSSMWPGDPPMVWRSAERNSLTMPTATAPGMGPPPCSAGSPYVEGQPPTNPLSIGIHNLWRYYADPCPRDYGDTMTYEHRIGERQLNTAWLEENADFGGPGARPYGGRYMPTAEIETWDKIFGVSDWGEG